MPGQARLLRVDSVRWTRPERMQRISGLGANGQFALSCFVAFGADCQCNACSAGPAPGAGRSPGAFRLAAFVSWFRWWHGSLARITSQVSPNSGSSWRICKWRLPCPVFCGFSTLLWSAMCVAAGPPRWSPGAACWREAFEIRSWDATCLPVVFSRGFRPLLARLGWFVPVLARPCFATAVFGPTVGSFWVTRDDF